MLKLPGIQLRGIISLYLGQVVIFRRPCPALQVHKTGYQISNAVLRCLPLMPQNLIPSYSDQKPAASPFAPYLSAQSHVALLAVVDFLLCHSNPT